jgi:DNA replication protein DnaC
MQPISEQRSGEAKEPMFSEASFDRMFGVDERQPGTCDQHGDFVDIHFSGKRNAPEGWKGCPECSRIAYKKKQDEEERNRQAQMYRDRIEGKVKNSGIPERFQGKSFENFDASSQKPANNLRKLREYAELVSSEDHGGRSLILLGKVGTGKTHLGCALLAHTIRATGQGCHYWTFAQLVREVKGSFSRESGYTEESVYSDFAAPRLLVLDEVGLQNFTGFEQAVAYEAINARYLAEKPTVLITNLQVADLPLCVGERVVDRLREGGGRALDFDWESYRVGGAS